MNKAALIGLLVCFTLTSTAQKSVTNYYKRTPLEEQVPQEKAKYSNTITTNPDGSITTELKNLKKNLVENRKVYKGEEPVGNWIYETGRGPTEINYDFNLEYSNQDCLGSLNIKNYFVDDPSIGYEAPKISTGEQFYQFISKRLVYPSKAVKENIQGKIDLTFDITKEGAIENIRIKKGVHIVLDKEAVRVIRMIILSSPPKINGQIQTVCATASVSFRLA